MSDRGRDAGLTSGTSLNLLAHHPNHLLSSWSVPTGPVWFMHARSMVLVSLLWSNSILTDGFLHLVAGWHITCFQPSYWTMALGRRLPTTMAT